jgi:hypothetical protein
MQQNERIELIKAAAILAAACNYGDKTRSGLIELLDHFYDYLQLKLEAGGNVDDCYPDALWPVSEA